MVIDKEEWLKLTQEGVIDPELPICDAHHHLWDHSGEIYMIDKFSEDIESGHKIVKTVYVECYMRYRKEGTEALRPVGETEYVKNVAEKYALRYTRTKVAAGMVAFADLMLGDAVKPVLEEHLKAGGEMVRSIRCSTIWDADSKIRTTSPPGIMLDGKFRSGFAMLKQYGLCFDTWLYFTQLPDLVELVKQFSDTLVILNHMSGLIGIGAYAGRREEILAQWKRSIAELAKYPNVYVKLGGLGTIRNGFGFHERELPPGSAELAAAWAPYFSWCIDNFGPGRCMFESNFPMDRHSCSYTVLWNTFKRVVAAYSKDEKTALFHDTAARVYRIEG